MKFADVPSAYYLHRGNHKIVTMLKNNNVMVMELERDTVIEVFVDYVSNITYSTQPYEGHFPHRDFVLTRTPIKENFLKGDYVIIPRQKSIRYILEALEADCPGSFFRWNYFDAYLQQKEGFSAYIFEEKAIAFLNENPEIKTAFLAKKESEKEFANNAYAQLHWVYQQTRFFEKEFMRIPVFRVF